VRFIELDSFDNKAAAFGRKLSLTVHPPIAGFNEIDRHDSVAAAFGRQLS
jgi:hypothetical protein